MMLRHAFERGGNVVGVLGDGIHAVPRSEAMLLRDPLCGLRAFRTRLARNRSAEASSGGPPGWKLSETSDQPNYLRRPGAGSERSQARNQNFLSAFSLANRRRAE